MTDPDALVARAPRLGEVQTQPSPDVPPHIARVLEMITDGFIALDSEDHFVYVNRQAEAMLGRSRKELLGLNAWDTFPREADSDFARAARRARTEDVHVTCENHAATLGLWFENQIYPTPDGLLFVYFRDITEARRLKEEASRLNAELRQQVEEFQALFDLLPVAVLVAEDPECLNIRANPAGERLLAVPPEANVSLSAASEQRTEAFRVMRDGRDVPAEELPMQVAAATGQEVRGSECQIVRSDGSESVIYGYSSPLFGADGKTRGSIGAFVDVTPMKCLEAELRDQAERLRQSEAGLRAILEGTPVILYAADPSGNVTLSEGAGLAALGLRPGEAVGRSVFEFSGGDAVIEANTRRALAGEAISFDAHYGELCLHSELRPIRGADGSPGGVIGVCFDLTERNQAEERLREYAVVLEFQKNELEMANTALEELATMDGLTGLSNHRAFQERLAEEVGRAARYGTPLSLILLDVDHFKQFNDSQGHPAGDEVLKAVARVLGQNARETDIVARYGGEEFAMLLPQTELDGAVVIADRLRAAVEDHGWLERAITASFGVAVLQTGSEYGADLIAHADRAMYQSKAEGRNRVTSAPDPTARHPALP